MACNDWGSDLLTGGTSSANCGTPANAFDDNLTTFWLCQDCTPYIQYYKAAGITAGKCRAYSVQHDNGGSFQLRGSDNGSNWSGVLCTVTVNVGSWQDHEFTECTYKYWRWTATAGVSGEQVAYIYELELYECQDPENIQINIGDVWKDMSEVKINIGDSWKTVTEMKINTGDVWKTIF